MTPVDYQELARLGVATIYEASGRQGLIDIRLHQIVPGSRAAGPARTVMCGQNDNLMVHAALATVKPGEILVVTMPEPAPVALVGDLLATQALAQGVAGLLIDGAVRDVEELRALGLPIWARFIRVRGATKTETHALNTAVAVGGTLIRPGDVVVLDADGAVVITDERVLDVLETARAREAKETELRAQFKAGQFSIDAYELRSKIESYL